MSCPPEIVTRFDYLIFGLAAGVALEKILTASLTWVGHRIRLQALKLELQALDDLKRARKNLQS